MEKIRKGDEIVVITGKDKGKRGSVLARVDVDHVLVEGINRSKKHAKPNPVKGVVGGIVEKNMPIQISNVALWNSKAGKGDRVGIKSLEDGRKVRVFKSTGEQVEA
jgi:large subunit ribosomal protein L24